MSRIIFKSLAHSDRAYTWHKSGIDGPGYMARSGRPICDNAGWFQTFNDGMVQHSGEYAVQVEDSVDYLISLAAHLLEFGDNVEILNDWPRVEHCVSVDKILFAFSVKHKDGKRQWYSKSEEKVSTSESKRHDRRWEEVHERLDGTFQSAMRILRGQYGERLYWLALADMIAKTGLEHGETCYVSDKNKAVSAGFCDETLDNNSMFPDRLIQAFRTVDSFVSGWRKTQDAKRWAGSLIQNYQNDLEKIQLSA